MSLARLRYIAIAAAREAKVSEDADRVAVEIAIVEPDPVDADIDAAIAPRRDGSHCRHQRVAPCSMCLRPEVDRLPIGTRAATAPHNERRAPREGCSILPVVRGQRARNRDEAAERRRRYKASIDLRRAEPEPEPVLLEDAERAAERAAEHLARVERRRSYWRKRYHSHVKPKREARKRAAPAAPAAGSGQS